MMPQAITVASVPSRTTRPLPDSQVSPGAYTSGKASRENRRYMGEGSSMAFFTTQSVCTASQGTNTLKLGRERMMAMSSSEWWLGPS